MEEVKIPRTTLLAIEKIVHDALQSTDSATETLPYLKGINALARFLKISAPTAQKLKNSGAIPFWQNGRTIYFDKAEVLKSIAHPQNSHS